MAAGDTAAVKKNLVVLLAIAFVIAVAATGIFYGLFADKFKDNSTVIPKQTVLVTARALKRGDVLTREDVRPVQVQVQSALQGALTAAEQAVGKTLMAPLAQGAPVLGSMLVNEGEVLPGIDDVPPKMRAVTLHVIESGTLLGLLHPGSRIDIQAVVQRGDITELRRVLQDVEVVSTGPAEIMASRNMLPQVTVLVRPDQTDIVALADTASRVRIVLRNRQDRSGAPAARLDLAAMLNGPLPSQAAPAASASAVPAEAFRVRMIAAAPATMMKFGAESAARSWHVLALPDGASDPAAGADELSSSEVIFSTSDTATVRAGNADCSVRIRLRLRQGLRISPELVWRDGGATRTASLDAHVDPGSAHGFAITGFNAALSGVLARAFPEHKLDGRELVVTIVPRREQALARQ